jgi:AraC-like DNA-binding protein
VDFALSMKHATDEADIASGTYRPEHPFLKRVVAIIDEWIEGEWDRKEAIRYEASALGWNAEREARYRDATLTAELLAMRVDGMSDAKFRRELKKIGAPRPGDLIRKARIRHAAKLLTHTRLLVKQIAERAGYSSEKHFTDAFRAELKSTPSRYRRASIESPNP